MTGLSVPERPKAHLWEPAEVMKERKERGMREREGRTVRRRRGDEMANTMRTDGRKHAGK